MGNEKMQRVNPLKACSVEKEKYDSCFKEWYKGKFLKVSNRIAAFAHRSLSLAVCLKASIPSKETRSARA